MFKVKVRIFKEDKLTSIGVVLFSAREPGRELFESIGVLRSNFSSQRIIAPTGETLGSRTVVYSSACTRKMVCC